MARTQTRVGIGCLRSMESKAVVLRYGRQKPGLLTHIGETNDPVHEIGGIL